MTDRPTTLERFDTFREIPDGEVEVFNRVWLAFAYAMEAVICAEIDPGERTDVYDSVAEANDVWGMTLDVSRPSDNLSSLMTDLEAVLAE